jgi:ankyrin repeat protein
LHYATTSKQSDMIALLLQYGANSSVKSKSGTTAADIAKKLQQPELVGLLASKCDNNSKYSKSTAANKIEAFKNAAATAKTDPTTAANLIEDLVASVLAVAAAYLQLFRESIILTFICM